MILFRIIKYQLYLLQLENYELGRYFRLLVKKGIWPQANQRKNLVWTLKAVLVLVVAVFLFLIMLFSLVFELRVLSYELWTASIISILFFIIFPFIFFSIATIILYPADWITKKILIKRAKSKLRTLSSQLKIIGIAGSYGKTTMKEILTQVLSSKYKVLSTPDSVNTPVGIARWILNSVTSEAEILIVEMGEHYKGDVEEICKIIKPDIAAVTGINESHLERMGSLDNVIATIFEIVSCSKPGAQILLNADDKNVMTHYKEYIWKDHRVEPYKIEDIGYRIFNTDKLVWEVKDEKLGSYEIGLLGEYALADVSAAVKIAQSLGMSSEQIKNGIAKIKAVSHRLEPIKGVGDVLIIDDAYNGNPQGVAEAIKVLSRFTNRHKIFITPGLVEMGSASADVHREIGRQLADVADVVVLIKNSVTAWIKEGVDGSVIARSLALFASKGLGDEAIVNKERLPRPSDEFGARNDKPEVIWFNTAQEAHSSLGKILKPGDVVVFQNDWGDQYL